VPGAPSPCVLGSPLLRAGAKSREGTEQVIGSQPVVWAVEGRMPDFNSWVTLQPAHVSSWCNSASIFPRLRKLHTRRLAAQHWTTTVQFGARTWPDLELATRREECSQF
jgi:hypothetical protein